ncbi:MAG: hypothetical protein EOM91_17350 [Sphingobacteriia bacterium]|nr:hypothetical protein [Sphingobacteriia bacterium]NCC41143.1 hypothetical protein [Gammaproteobacteria bacterium]
MIIIRNQSPGMISAWEPEDFGAPDQAISPVPVMAPVHDQTHPHPRQHPHPREMPAEHAHPRELEDALDGWSVTAPSVQDTVRDGVPDALSDTAPGPGMGSVVSVIAPASAVLAESESESESESEPTAPMPSAPILSAPADEPAGGAPPSASAPTPALAHASPTVEAPVEDAREVVGDAAADVAGDVSVETLAGTSAKTPQETDTAPAPETHQEGHSQGDDAGHKIGHAEGYAAGYQEGYASAYAAAHQEGYAAGRASGYEAGRQAGHDTGAQEAGALIERLRQLIESVGAATRGLQQEVADELLALSLAIAHKVTGQTLAQMPETILETIHAALAHLPQTHAQIHLHPDDLTLVRQRLGDHPALAGHRLIEDPDISRGGCKIATNTVLADATLEKRWERVLESVLPRRPKSSQGPVTHE